jgi:hypothetical protein
VEFTLAFYGLNFSQVLRLLIKLFMKKFVLGSLLHLADHIRNSYLGMVIMAAPTITLKVTPKN